MTDPRPETTYALAIKFLSNERPYSTTYQPARPIADDADAIKWARGMQSGMGGCYAVVLLKDGKQLELGDQRDAK